MRSASAAGAGVAVAPLPRFDEADDAVFLFAVTDFEALAMGLDQLARDVALRRENGMLRGLAAGAGAAD